MRRTTALLALLAMSWPHVAALDCVSGSVALSEVPHAAHHGAPSSDDEAGTERRAGLDARSGPDTPAGGRQCAIVMACGLMMIQAESATATLQRPGALLTGGLGAVEDLQGTVLVRDPPPPRRFA